MSGRTQEIPHNTPEQVRGYLSEALEILSELELEDELKPVAFVKAIELLSSKQIIIEQIQPGILNSGLLGQR